MDPAILLILKDAGGMTLLASLPLSFNLLALLCESKYYVFVHVPICLSGKKNNIKVAHRLLKPLIQFITFDQC